MKKPQPQPLEIMGEGVIVTVIDPATHMAYMQISPAQFEQYETLPHQKYYCAIVGKMVLVSSKAPATRMVAFCAEPNPALRTFSKRNW